ncbi:hypothetical protein NH340_JMT07807 [Sarcoptes scabiei]|nr:hypothetical protein NH340_JMT07807 [Sarcoptes scabiei]
MFCLRLLTILFLLMMLGQIESEASPIVAIQDALNRISEMAKQSMFKDLLERLINALQEIIKMVQNNWSKMEELIKGLYKT